MALGDEAPRLPSAPGQECAEPELVARPPDLPTSDTRHTRNRE